MTFKNFTCDDYQAVCDFLVEINQGDRKHINWNWARFEWMYEHPEFDKDSKNAIGLWIDGGRVVGAAIYDMYFGEGFCGALPEYAGLYPEILDYACNHLSDDAGFAFAIADGSLNEIKAAEQVGFAKIEQSENMMRISLDKPLPAKLPEGISLSELDPSKELYNFQWLLWQGFDHGSDREEFENDPSFVPVVPVTDGMFNRKLREHFDPRLSIAAVDGSGEKVGYCCLWYCPKTDYAYVEPVCVIPAYRGKGVARAVIYEALNRARALGAKSAYVISDMDFYRRLGFEDDKHFTFYRRK